MSLIDEALKRAQAAERAGQERERPWIPTPLPDPGRRRWSRVLPLAVGTVAAAALVGGAAVYFTRPEPAVPAAVAPPAARPEAPAAEVPLPSVEVPPRPGGADPAAEKLGLAARKSAPPPAAEEPERPAVPEAKPAVPAGPAALTAGRTYVREVALPDGRRIELGGIVFSETDPRALLNDRVAGVGAYVEGFTVSAIDEERVSLEKDGLTIHLALK